MIPMVALVNRPRSATRAPRVILCLIVGGLLALRSDALALGADEWYLDGYHGPYQGRVIDGDSKEPLAGVAVVAVWRREIIFAPHSSTVVYRTKETVTDPDGYFMLHAREVEEGAPRWTRRPTFVMFLPNYTVFQGIREGRFEKSGTTIELRRLNNWRERMGLNDVDPYSLSDYPFRDFPRLMQLFNEERASRGFKPYLPMERPPQ